MKISSDSESDSTEFSETESDWEEQLMVRYSLINLTSRYLIY